MENQMQTEILALVSADDTKSPWSVPHSLAYSQEKMFKLQFVSK